MTPRTHIPFSDSGFTLIEIIVTILIGSVLAAMMIQFMGTALTGSSGPVNIVRDNSAVEALMETIVSEYVEKINDNSANPLETVRSDYLTNSSVTMDFIKFSSGTGTEINMGATSTNTLKVTVKLAGHSLITLLTNSRTKPDDPVSKF